MPAQTRTAGRDRTASPESRRRGGRHGEFAADGCHGGLPVRPCRGDRSTRTADVALFYRRNGGARRAICLPRSSPGRLGVEPIWRIGHVGCPRIVINACRCLPTSEPSTAAVIRQLQGGRYSSAGRAGLTVGSRSLSPADCRSGGRCRGSSDNASLARAVSRSGRSPLGQPVSFMVP